MIQIISAVIQIIFLIMKDKFERDAEKRKIREVLHDEAKTAIKNRDASAINSVLTRMRNS